MVWQQPERISSFTTPQIWMDMVDQWILLKTIQYISKSNDIGDLTVVHRFRFAGKTP